MFDRDIFKALIGEIADTREVEIGCDEPDRGTLSANPYQRWLPVRPAC